MQGIKNPKIMRNFLGDVSFLLEQKNWNVYLFNRYLLRFFDRWAHETMYAYIGNENFFSKACHRQTYQNSKISWQRMLISDFQSEFSMSKIVLFLTEDA